jgi:hypothetical protein
LSAQILRLQHRNSFESRFRDINHGFRGPEIALKNLTCLEKGGLLSGAWFLKDHGGAGLVWVGVLTSVDWICHMFQWGCLAQQISGRYLPPGEDACSVLFNSLQSEDRNRIDNWSLPLLRGFVERPTKVSLQCKCYCSLAYIPTLRTQLVCTGSVVIVVDDPFGE